MLGPLEGQVNCCRNRTNLKKKNDNWLPTQNGGVQFRKPTVRLEDRACEWSNRRECLVGEGSDVSL